MLIVSIRTIKGARVKGVPTGTIIEKNFLVTILVKYQLIPFQMSRERTIGVIRWEVLVKI